MKHLAFAAVALAAAAPIRANVVFDQISYGANNSFLSQIFTQPSNMKFDTSLADDFTLLSTTHLTAAEVAVGGFSSIGSGLFTSLANITGYRVEIYSSQAGAQNFLLGDLLNTSVTAAGATVTAATFPNYADGLTAIVNLPIDVTLGAGTYWLAIEGILADENADGSFGVLSGNPGDSFQLAPYGGFDAYFGSDHYDYTGKAAGYRLFDDTVPAVGVPEPASWALLVVGFGLTGAAARRATRAHS